MIKYLTREPLILFFLSGGLIFLFYGILVQPETPRIFITEDTITDLFEMREELLGRILHPDEKMELIDRYIENEILVREAVARGLHLGDSRVRQRLAGKMYFLLDDTPPEPGEEELRVYYSANRQKYMLPPAVSFEHVFFINKEDADRAALKQQGHNKYLDPESDNLFWLGRVLRYYSDDQLISILGVNFTKDIKDISKGVWSTPIQSARGWHIVKVIEIHEAQPLPPEELKNQLYADWKEDWKLSRRAEKIDLLSRAYEIVRQNSVSKSEKT